MHRWRLAPSAGPSHAVYMVRCSYIARTTWIRRVAACLLSLLRRVLCITTRYVAVPLLGSLFVSFSLNGPMHAFAGNCIPHNNHRQTHAVPTFRRSSNDLKERRLIAYARAKTAVTAKRSATRAEHSIVASAQNHAAHVLCHFFTQFALCTSLRGEIRLKKAVGMC